MTITASFTEVVMVIDKTIAIRAIVSMAGLHQPQSRLRRRVR